MSKYTVDEVQEMASVLLDNPKPREWKTRAGHMLRSYAATLQSVRPPAQPDAGAVSREDIEEACNVFYGTETWKKFTPVSRYRSWIGIERVLKSYASRHARQVPSMVLFAIERCLKSQESLAASIDAANPDDPYASLMVYEDIEQIRAWIAAAPPAPEKAAARKFTGPGYLEQTGYTSTDAPEKD